MIETYRKLFLTSVLSVISPGSTKQIVVANLFCAGCLIVYVVLGPFDDAELAMTSSICQVQVWYILFISILIKEDVAISQAFLNASIIIAILFVVFYDLFWSLVEFCPLPKGVTKVIDNFTLSKSIQRELSAEEAAREAVNRASAALTNLGIEQLHISDLDSYHEKMRKKKIHIAQLKSKFSLIEKNRKFLREMEQTLNDKEDWINKELYRVESTMEESDNESEIYSLDLSENSGVFQGKVLSGKARAMLSFESTESPYVEVSDDDSDSKGGDNESWKGETNEKMVELEMLDNSESNI